MVLLVACGGMQSGEPAGGPTVAPAQDASAQRFPDVIGAELTRSGETWSLAVTISSPYDSPERYADGWRVLAPDGTVLGEHTLTHDHAGEQPFTRTMTGLRIPEGVEQIVVEGRDLAHGYGGTTTTIEVRAT